MPAQHAKSVPIPTSSALLDKQGHELAELTEQSNRSARISSVSQIKSKEIDPDLHAERSHKLSSDMSRTGLGDIRTTRVGDDSIPDPKENAADHEHWNVLRSGNERGACDVGQDADADAHDSTIVVALYVSVDHQ